jgi:5-methylcytosine-specific restriction endonuclease McrA
MELAERTEYCTLCETKLYWGFKGDGKIHSNSPSLDRKDNRSDLTPENSQITCTRCNVTKGDRSMEEFVSYCQDIALKFGDVMHS